LLFFWKTLLIPDGQVLLLTVPDFCK